MTSTASGGSDSRRRIANLPWASSSEKEPNPELNLKQALVVTLVGEDRGHRARTHLGSRQMTGDGTYPPRMGTNKKYDGTYSRV